MIVLDASLGVVKVNRAFLDIFETEAAVIQSESVFAIDRGALDIPALRTALDDVSVRVLNIGKPHFVVNVVRRAQNHGRHTSLS